MDDRTGQEPKSEYFAKLSKGNSNKRACAIAWSYSVFDEEYHKAWCIDQMMRVLAGGSYEEFVQEYEKATDRKWDEGVAPFSS